MGDAENNQNYKKLKQRVINVCKIQEEAKLKVDSKKFVESFSSGLMDVTLGWSRGAAFAEIAKMTKVYEGSIIRVLKRLDELMAELVKCANLMGNESLTKRFESCRKKLHRDIVFQSS